MKKILLLTLHGMGIEDPDYYLQFEKKLQKKMGKSWEHISFHPVDYAGILQTPEGLLWDKLVSNKRNRLNWQFLRKFLLFGIGDAASLEHSASHDGKKYIEVQKKIFDALERGLSELENDAPKSVVIIAHSLGGQVISNYLWDAQENKNLFKEGSPAGNAAADFMRLKTLSYLLTVGCNIPIFNAGLDDRVCFSKPNGHFKWDNFYDADDVLGWPLQDLGPTYTFITDRPVRLKGWFTGWNPLSHQSYWSDRGIISHVSRVLKSHLK